MLLGVQVLEGILVLLLDLWRVLLLGEFCVMDNFLLLLVSLGEQKLRELVSRFRKYRHHSSRVYPLRVLNLEFLVLLVSEDVEKLLSK